ncbi:PSP1 C-terminal domain protein [Porphyromonas sp. oral taxon 279 str. F0450]|nr:PSP1 C-terminal domain protein [Porphyromonas sp. oral taxon 279 str. F0450]
MSTYDWLNDIPESLQSSDLVEVQFKNTRKGYYLNTERIDLYKGDIVAVESTTGHDIGEVTLTGKLAELAMRNHRYRPDKGEFLHVYRVARPGDLERWEEAKRREEPTMIQARQIASSLGLDMKIGDVEYQGDGNKAIFYYIADGRVDFRQLIRVLADTFHVRIEMKQIGARQEAGRIGGIGPCGRQLCCSSWMTTFSSVSTGAARVQDITMNPQKLTGQCGKIKCCMNFEVNAYAEAQRSLPDREVVLETSSDSYYHFKTDHFQRQVTYSTVRNAPVRLVTISAERAFEVISLNRRGERPEHLEETATEERRSSRSSDILADNSLTRFDRERRGGRRGGDSRGSRRGGDQGARRERSARPSDEAGKSNNGNGGERPQVRQFRSPRTPRTESTGEGGQQRIRRPRPETSGEDKG